LRWTGIRAPFDPILRAFRLTPGSLTRHARLSVWIGTAGEQQYERLTMMVPALLKKNHNAMNKRFLAALVKILAAVFTNRMMVVDLLWRACDRLG
jgi:hypothetical protein